MKRISLIALPFILCLLLCGCGGRSLSDYTIVQGVGIDKRDDMVSVSLQYLNLAKSNGATDSLTENITTVVDGESRDISDAVFSASKELSQEIFFGQNKLVVFGDEYIRDDISTGLDYLLRSVDSRPDVLVAVSDKKASDIIKSTQRDARIPSESIYDLIRTGEVNGLGVVVTVNDLLRLYSSKTSDIYMPVLRTRDDVTSCTGIAVFSNEKYAVSLDEQKTLAFLLMLDRVEDASMVVHSNELGNVGVELVSQSAKRSVSTIDGRVIFNCDIKVEIILDDVQRGVTANVNDDRIDEIERLVENRIVSDARAMLSLCSNAGCDPLEIGKYLAKENPSLYNSMKDAWRENLKDVEFNITSNARLSKVNDSLVK